MSELILPPHIHAYAAVLGERLRPAEETLERTHRAGWEWIKARGSYPVDGLAEGTELAVSAGRHPEQAYVVRSGAAASIRVAEAEDILDPAGARRRAWERRLLGTGLSERPRRYRLETGHGLESDLV
ncbi:hypothetical protein [Methylobacterium sp. J-070]|uniref:hypothetical protein n=1 Tax=Methylobacterium sp. J-070 TaxID=2836650 RepID=UPI001FBA5F4F|nr:hypothetical protein [Methylobacterium sp. J-070]MCJ2048793.1 hypothetical protein [Methylobacterium sp. J-070]